jgi:hypothetical protein
LCSLEPKCKIQTEKEKKNLVPEFCPIKGYNKIERITSIIFIRKVKYERINYVMTVKGKI